MHIELQKSARLRKTNWVKCAPPRKFRSIDAAVAATTAASGVSKNRTN